MIKLILGVALGVAFGLTLYNHPDGVAKFFLGIIGIITRPIRYFFGVTETQKEKKAFEKEQKREEEYQDAIARGDANAKISKECYFLMKEAKEREEEKKKIQAKIDKYGSNISDDEVERIEMRKKQKAEYDALPQEEKDKIKKKHKRDRIVIIVALLSPYIIFGLIYLIAEIIS